jgi:adenylate kinase family enzyme
MNRVVAIFGPPGAGKTTTARGVVEALGAAYLSSGDVARKVDPGSIARGDMADRQLLADGFRAELSAIRKHHQGWIVVDGLPRDPSDVDYLPDGTTYILLNAARDISI